MFPILSEQDITAIFYQSWQSVIIHIPRVRRRGLPWEWEGEEGQLWLR
jgi:hypothetical protein